MLNLLDRCIHYANYIIIALHTEKRMTVTHSPDDSYIS